VINETGEFWAWSDSAKKCWMLKLEWYGMSLVALRVIYALYICATGSYLSEGYADQRHQPQVVSRIQRWTYGRHRSHWLVSLMVFITGPPNGPVLFCSLTSVVVVCRLSSSVTVPADGPAGRARGRPTLYGGPIVLRPVRATPCCNMQM